MAVETYVQPTAIVVAAETAAQFAPHEQATPNMTVALDAGRVFAGSTNTVTEVASQSTATITAPTTNPRKDVVYIDRVTGAVGVATGTEAASPTDPAIPDDKAPVARINLTTSTTTIINAELDDLRVAGVGIPGPFGTMAKQNADNVAITGGTMAGVSPTGVTSINGGPLAGFRNVVINGGFSINERAATSNADDTYGHDRWYALTQSGTIAVSTLSDVENGLPTMARLTQSQAMAQRMGYAQIVEGGNCKHLRGQEVTFSFRRFRCSVAQAIRFAVLEWTGTEDSVTSDVVNDWTSASYTAGGFFLGSSLTITGVTSNTPSAATLTGGPAITATLGSAFNNLIVMAWVEGTAAQNVTLDLGEAQLEIGGAATAFERRPIGTELALCQCFYRPLTVDAAQIFSLNAGVNNPNRVDCTYEFPTMRAAPTLITSGTAGDYRVTDFIGGGGATCTSVPALMTGASPDRAGIKFVANAHGLTLQTNARHFAVNANGILALDAEL